MLVPLHEVGRRGRLNLRFSSRHGRTVIRDCYCETPFKITRLHPAAVAGIAHLILMQSTAGLFAGDTTDCAIHVESGARVLITQQSATKAHPSCGTPAVQKTRIQVEAGGELHIYYEPVIPFSAARVSQNTRIEADYGAKLYFWEALMAGRIGRGEIWRFEEFSSETSFSLNGRALYLDRFRLRPGDARPDTDWRMGGACCLATGLCFDESRGELAERMHQAMAESVAGIDSPSPGLTVARVVAGGGLELRRCRAAFASAALGPVIESAWPGLL